MNQTAGPRTAVGAAFAAPATRLVEVVHQAIGHQFDEGVRSGDGIATLYTIPDPCQQSSARGLRRLGASRPTPFRS